MSRTADSGLVNSGEPLAWDIMRLGLVATARSGTDVKDEFGCVPLYGANGVIGTSDAASQVSGALLVGRVGSAGAVTLATERCAVSDNALIIKLKRYGSRRFFFYLLSALDLKSEISNTAQPLLTASLLLNQRVAIPRSVEAEAVIAAFLDRETAKIDTLIAKQERLIELLIEKRQAVISHAVTRGLYPDVAMKESGVPWIGLVPDTWRVLPLKRIIRSVTSGSRGWAEFYSHNGDIFLRIGNLTRESIDLDLTDTQHVAPPNGLETRRSTVDPGDLLISITADLGSVAVVPRLENVAYVSQHIALVKPAVHVVPRWLAYALKATPSQRQLRLSGYGGTKIQLGLDDVRDVVVAVPPQDEQRELALWLDRAVSRLDVLSQKAMRSIELMREHRAALITAAVTGKIDVRDSVEDVA